MNRHFAKKIDAGFQRQLDRLVDNELPDNKRRELLQSLDNRDGGWRQCALTFLEAQSWRQAVSEMAISVTTNPHKAGGNSAKSIRPSSTVFQSSSTCSWAMLAASVAVAFLIGRSFESIRPDARTISPEIMTVSEAGNGLSANHTMRPQNKRAVIQPSYASSPSTVVRRHVSVIPGEVEEALDQLGTHIRRRRRFVPGRSQDGREWVVPVEDVELVPTKYMTY